MTDEPTPITSSRRQMLQRLAGGAGLLGLAGVLDQACATPASPGNPKKVEFPSHPARAKRVIFLFLNGGPSQMDMFDPKPGVSAFSFARHGESGLELSELLPELGRHADDLCIIRSMRSATQNHEFAMIEMQAGSRLARRPSFGSWALYGLGSENRNLPGYVVLRPQGVVMGGPRNWSSGFLPSEFQGTEIVTRSMKVDQLLRFVRGSGFSLSEQRVQLDVLKELNEHHAARTAGDAEMEAEIRAMETAYRMQIAATDAFDLEREPEVVCERYGESEFAKSCLLARRLAERGVRLTTVYFTGGAVTETGWDTHANHREQMKRLCADTDRAVSALLGDLKQRGLLDDTIVMMGGEFGRTIQAGGETTGHQNEGFSMMLAGGGIRGGTTYGATGGDGLGIAADPVEVSDLHATVLHLMGLDHQQLTFHQTSRHFRLGGKGTRVVREILA